MKSIQTPVTVLTEHRKCQPSSSLCWGHWGTLTRQTLDPLLSPRPLDTEKKKCGALSMVDLFYSWVSQRTDCGLNQRKKKNEAFCKRVEACGRVWNYSWSCKAGKPALSPTKKADTMDNSCRPGGLFFGSCAFKTTNKRSSPLAQCCLMMFFKWENGFIQTPTKKWL